MDTLKVKYLNYNTIVESLKEYSSPKSKITNLLNSGKLIKIKRDLFISGEIKMSIQILSQILYTVLRTYHLNMPYHITI